MKVNLIFFSPLMLAIRGARTCYDSMENSTSIPCTYCNGYDMTCEYCYGDGFLYGDKDKRLLERLIKDGHTSVIEHIYYTFHIKNITRGLLQQLVRHRIASYSVKSTRYTLKELVKADNDNALRKLFRQTGERYFDTVNLITLRTIRGFIKVGSANDEVKYLLPEAFYTELTMTINARSLRNLLNLRLDKRAWKEFQELAKNIYDVLPKSHKEIIFQDIAKKYLTNEK